jgi:hypothetical protein
MMTASQAAVSPTVDTIESSPARAAMTAAALLGTALLAFLKGALLSGLLNLIPILPAYKRSTFSIMSRSFALFLFGPLAAFVLAAFPLLFVAGYRRAVVSLCERSSAWYAKQDLAY